MKKSNELYVIFQSQNAAQTLRSDEDQYGK